MDPSAFAQKIDIHGWAVEDRVINEATLVRVENDIAPIVTESADRGGVRNLLDSSTAVVDLAQSNTLRALASAVLGKDCAVVRVIYFDKTPDTNWRVVWHQDLTIAVKSKHATPGYGPWSEKAGVVHVQPPAAILEQMLAVRVHLDDCDSDNGPVRVIPGSHRAGRLSPEQIDEWKDRVVAQECLALRGDVVAFRPLLLHASSPARTPRHRRVLHFEYSSATLPPELKWHAWIGERLS